MKKPLLILTGPTAVGKTKLSLSLAKAVGGEILSADSMQVYRNMDIGSAKIRPEEMEGIPHHPLEDFNVVIFQRMCKECMHEIYQRNHIPILTGGTGFYIQSVLYDIDFTEHDTDSDVRKRLEKTADEKGPEYLHDMLEKVDPKSAKMIHANNVKRVIRAIEYYRQTGQKISEHNNEQRSRKSPYNFAYVVLNDDRMLLYKRIDDRVDRMIEEGLTDEVRRLMDKGYDRNLVSMQGLGYKEMIAYLNGEMPFDEAVYVIKRDTRHFAKRQLTWFGRERDVNFIRLDELRKNNDCDIIDAAIDRIMELLSDKGIIENKGERNERF